MLFYTFTGPRGPREFGPYRSQDEAKSAFQRVFGYWPEDATDFRPYEV